MQLVEVIRLANMLRQRIDDSVPGTFADMDHDDFRIGICQDVFCAGIEDTALFFFKALATSEDSPF